MEEQITLKEDERVNPYDIQVKNTDISIWQESNNTEAEQSKPLWRRAETLNITGDPDY